MKKHLLIALLLVMACSLAGCKAFLVELARPADSGTIYTSTWIAPPVYEYYPAPVIYHEKHHESHGSINIHSAPAPPRHSSPPPRSSPSSGGGGHHH